MPLPETSGHLQTSLGQSFVGSLLLSPGSWCAKGFVCALQESVSPVLCKFWQLFGGVSGDLLQEGLLHNQFYCTQSPDPVPVHCWPVLLQETLEHSSTSVSEGPLGPSVHKICLSPLSVSGGYGFASKHDFAVPALLLGLLLCLWMWAISSQPLQRPTAAALVPTVLGEYYA